VQHHTECDVSANAQTQSKNNPLTHHGSDSGRKGSTFAENGMLGGRGLGRLNLRRGDQARQVIRHEIQRLFPAIRPAALLTTLDR